MINTLIAILADTYARITSAKDSYAIRQRTEIYADFIHLIYPSNFTTKKYVYLVKPDNDSEGDAWEGALGAVKARIAKIENHLQEVKKSNKDESDHNRDLLLREI